MKRHFKSLLLLIALAALTTLPKQAFADRYDDEIAAEKAGQRLADRINAQDEAGREAAKQRYEKAHPSSSDSSGGGAFVLLTIFATVFLSIITIISKKRPTKAVQPTRQSECARIERMWEEVREQNRKRAEFSRKHPYWKNPY